MKTAFILTAGNLRPGASDRRSDADLVDRQAELLDIASRPYGIRVQSAVWSDLDPSSFEGEAVLPLTVWDYQEQPEAVMDLLQSLTDAGVPVFNPLSLIRWNSRKTYLQELEAAGVPVVPTIWSEEPTANEVMAAFAAFETETVVVKRQVGAGARGQVLLSRSSPPSEGRVLDRPGMIQPFMSSIRDEGEYAFIFVEGRFSHAVVKRPAPDDYRIQTRFGGTSTLYTPTEKDLEQARQVLGAAPERPLYARVDMVRDSHGVLRLMELEVFEPFLFAHLGDQFGKMFARALSDRLSAG